MKYDLLEILLVTTIVAFSAYHVAKMLLPATISRLRSALGRKLEQRVSRGRLQTFAVHLQSNTKDTGCGSCGSNSHCRSCADTGLAKDLRVESGKTPAA